VAYLQGLDAVYVRAGFDVGSGVHGSERGARSGVLSASWARSGLT
jgi:hypothetical protein